MKRFILCSLLILGIGYAEPTPNTLVSLNMSLAMTPSVETLAFSDVQEPVQPYTTYIEQRYAPGETISINVRLSTSKQVSVIKAIVFGQTVDLQEFEEGGWTGYYRLPRDIQEGSYFLKLFIKGVSLNGTETLPFVIAYRINTVDITGNVRVSESELAEVVNLKPGEYYDPVRVEVNRQRIIDLGFFEKVSAVSKVVGSERMVRYYVRENPVIRKIDIVGSIEFSKEELVRSLVLKPGDTLASRQLQKDLIALEKFYKDKEYMFFRILSVERPTSVNNYTLLIKVNEGKVRSVGLKGNSYTKDYVVTREMEMKAGNIFNGGVLKEDLRRIYNLNYFSTVVPDLKFDEDTGEVDVTVNVEEKKTSSVNFGGGYGQIQGWFGFVDLFLDNIFGTAQSVNLKSQFGQKLTSYQFTYHNPWMWDKKTSFTGKLWSTYGFNYLTGERELRNGWSGTIGFQRTLHVRESYTYRYEDVFNLTDRAGDYKDRAVVYSISYDDRDQWMNPTTGKYDIFTMDHSSKLLGGTINTSRYSLQLHRFFPLAEKQVLAWRGMYNYQLGDVFPSEQYYVGSDTTVRGYRYVFARGNERCVFNFEYRYIFSDMFVGVLFYDIGQATKPVQETLADGTSIYNHNGWGSGQGFGVRIITPLGPIRLDYGWPQYYEFADGFLSFNMGSMF
jgi:outer membrane protein insertion porin family